MGASPSILGGERHRRTGAKTWSRPPRHGERPPRCIRRGARQAQTAAPQPNKAASPPGPARIRSAATPCPVPARVRISAESGIVPAASGGRPDPPAARPSPQTCHRRARAARVVGLGGPAVCVAASLSTFPVKSERANSDKTAARACASQPPCAASALAVGHAGAAVNAASFGAYGATPPASTSRRTRVPGPPLRPGARRRPLGLRVTRRRRAACVRTRRPADPSGTPPAIPDGNRPRPAPPCSPPSRRRARRRRRRQRGAR